ncbi:MAG: RecQ family ATP-dependent DNA helicase, partial [Cyclobacteriaceae bacterium]
SLLLEGVCLVITPLIALMEDQVNQLKRRGIAAVAIHSGMTKGEIDITLDNCAYGKIKFLYLSPERIQTEIFKERLHKIKVNLIAIDEAHCISQWGFDFRPSYLLISELKDVIPDTPTIALTATATKKVKGDIIEKLKLDDPKLFQISFARKNLSFVVRKTENKEKLLLQILQKVNGSSIVYVRSRKATEKLASWLSKNKVNSTFYHAGLSHQQRSEAQKKWIEGNCRVVVATNAFGMGIDKPDVRTVIHFDLPETLEAYYQEAGRAGRDGKRCYAVILSQEIDNKTLRDKVEQSQPNLKTLKSIYQALSNYFQLAEGSGMGESFNFDLHDFASRFKFPPVSAHAALKKLEEQAVISLSDSYYRPSQLHFQIDTKKLYEFQVSNDHFDQLIKALLRLYGAELFSSFVPISELLVSKTVGWTIPEVKIGLNQLHKMQFLSYEVANDSPQITFLTARQDADRLQLDEVRLEERRTLSIQKMEAMIEYVNQSHRCRTQFIQSYFDEETFDKCGVCDVCLSQKKKENQTEVKNYQEKIMACLRNKPMTSEELELAVNPTDHELFIEVVREMLDAARIKFDEYWVLRIK